MLQKNPQRTIIIDMKVAMPIVFSFLLMLCMSCTEEPPKIKRMPYYDGCYNWKPNEYRPDETICDFYFLVKNQPEDIRELYEFLQRAADDFLIDEILSQCREALFKRNPGKSEKTNNRDSILPNVRGTSMEHR